LALGSTLKRPAPPPNNQEADFRKKQRIERAQLFKGKGKGKGKGGKRPREGKCAQQTPDGKRICYGFNSKNEGCARTTCIFLHACGKCFKDHPMWQCTA